MVVHTCRRLDEMAGVRLQTRRPGRPNVDASSRREHAWVTAGLGKVVGVGTGPKRKSLRAGAEAGLASKHGQKCTDGVLCILN